MFRQHAGLVLLSILAVSFTPAQANDTDESHIAESPPRIEIPYGITVSGTTESRADPLQPTFNTVISANSDRIFYDLHVDVLTNGDLNNIDVIAACVFTTSEASRNSESERDALCGYGAANPTNPPADDYDSSKALSMAWTTAEGFRMDGTNSHALGTSTESTDSVSRIIDSTTITYEVQRLKFQFALSHAALNRSDWTVRVVAVSTPPANPNPPENDAPRTSQRTELLLDTACSDSYVAQVANSGCGVPDAYGVSFLGGFSSSTNRSVNYGFVNENSSSVVRSGIETGNYYANDSADLTIAASDFTNSSDSSDTIPLISGATTRVGEEQNRKRIALECTTSDVKGSDLLLSSTVQNLFTGLDSSSGEDPPESSKAAPTHDCQLHYGIGAAFANSKYTSVVEVGIKDGDTATGPTAQAVGVTPSP